MSHGRDELIKNMQRRSQAHRHQPAAPGWTGKLSGHTDEVKAVAYSADSKTFFSCSNDNTVHMYDGKTSDVLKSFKGHSSHVMVMVVSDDGNRLYTGDRGGTIIQWAIQNGEEDEKSEVWWNSEQKAVENRKVLHKMKKAGKVAFESTTTTHRVKVVKPEKKWRAHAHDQGTDRIRSLGVHTCETKANEDGGVGKKRSWKKLSTTRMKEYLISVSDDCTVKRWDLDEVVSSKKLEDNDNCVTSFKGHAAKVISVATSPSSRLANRFFTGGEDKNIIMWNATPGNEVEMGEKRFQGHTDWVYSLAVTNNGRRLISGSSDKSIIVWDIASATSLKTMVGHSGTVTSLALGANDSFVFSASKDATLRMWDFEKGANVKTFRGHTEPVISIAVNDDCTQLVSASDDTTVRVHDVGLTTDASLIKYAGAHNDKDVVALAVSRDGMSLITGGGDNATKMWRTPAATNINDDGSNCADKSDDFDVGRGASKTAKKIAIEAAKNLSFNAPPEHKINPLFGMGEEEVDGFGFDDGDFGMAEEAEAEAEVEPSSKVKVKEEEAVNVGGDGGDDGVDGTMASIMKMSFDSKNGGHADLVASVAVSPDGRYIFTGSWDYSVKVWDTHSTASFGGDGKPLIKTLEHPTYVNQIALSEDGTYLITACYFTVYVVNIKKALALDDQQQDDPNHTIKLDDVKDKTIVKLLVEHKDSIWCVATTTTTKADGSNIIRIFSSGTEGFIIEWNLEKGEIIHTYDDDNDGMRVNAVTFNQSYLYSAGGNNNTIMWDTAAKKQKQLCIFKGHTATVNYITTTLDGSFLITGGDDKSVKVWITRQGQDRGSCVATIPFDHYISSICMPPTPQLAGFSDGMLYVAAGKTVYVLPQLHTLTNSDTLPTWSLDQIAAVDRNDPTASTQFKQIADQLDQDATSTGATNTIKANPYQALFSEPFYLDLAKQGSIVGLEKCLFKLKHVRVPTTLIPYADLCYEAFVGGSLETIEFLLHKLADGIKNHNAVVAKTADAPLHMHAQFASDFDFVPLLSKMIGKRYPKVMLQFLSEVPLLRTSPIVDGPHFNGRAVLGKSGQMVTAISTKGPHAENFWSKKNAVDAASPSADSVAIESVMTPFPGFLTSGAGGFVGELLCNTGADSVQQFTSIIVHAIISHKWARFGFRWYKYELYLYLLSLAVFLAISIASVQQRDVLEQPLQSRSLAQTGTLGARYTTGAEQSLVALFGVSLLLLAREVWNEIRMFYNGVPGGAGLYFSDAMNLLRLVQAVMVAASAAAFFTGSGEIIWIIGFTSFFKWLTLCYYLQPAPQIGPIIYMIQAIFWDIRGIMLILSIVIFGLANITYVVNGVSPDLLGMMNGTINGTANGIGVEPGSAASIAHQMLVMGREFRNPIDASYSMYRLAMFGELSEDMLNADDLLKWTLWRLLEILSTLLCTVVLLNLLIARMSDSYERIQETAEPEERRKRAMLITQLEARWGVGVGMGDSGDGGNSNVDRIAIFGDDGNDDDGDNAPPNTTFLHALIERGSNCAIVPKLEWSGVLEKILFTINTAISIGNRKIFLEVDATYAMLDEKLDGLIKIVKDLPSKADNSGSVSSLAPAPLPPTTSSASPDLESKINKLEDHIAKLAASTTASANVFTARLDDTDAKLNDLSMNISTMLAVLKQLEAQLTKSTINAD